MWFPTKDEANKMTKNAVKEYWNVRYGGVLAGDTMDGFEKMLKNLIKKMDIKDVDIIVGRNAKIPGYFRMSKDWDMVVLKTLPDSTRRLLAVIEFKSMHGSVGNNLNNRVEEAVGSSYDFWKAFENGAFGAIRPFLGYIYLITDHPQNKNGTNRNNILFDPLPEYQKFYRTSSPANYEERLELFLTKLIHEQLYNNCALIIANEEKKGQYTTPNYDLSIELFIRSFVGYLAAHKD